MTAHDPHLAHLRRGLDCPERGEFSERGRAAGPGIWGVLAGAMFLAWAIGGVWLAVWAVGGAQ